MSQSTKFATKAHDKAMKALRDAALGTEVRHFLGIETGFSLKVRNVNAGITFYRFFDASDNTIQGFSGGQLAGGISLSMQIPLLK